MYENKTIEELIDLLEGQDDEIEELKQEANEAEALQEEVCALQEQIDDFNAAMGDREEVSEKAYYAGYQCCNDGLMTILKGWLTFKMEARL